MTPLLRPKDLKLARGILGGLESCSLLCRLLYKISCYVCWLDHSYILLLYRGNKRFKYKNSSSPKMCNSHQPSPFPKYLFLRGVGRGQV